VPAGPDPEAWEAAPGSAARERARRREQRQLEREQKPSRIRLPRPPRGPSSGLLAARGGRALVGAVGALALATVVGLVALWPSQTRHGPSHALGGKTLAATVAQVVDQRCPGPVAQRCRQLRVRIDEGPDRGQVVPLTLGPANLTSRFGVGDSVRVQRLNVPAGARVKEPYTLAGLDRRGTLLWLTIAFALMVIVLARARGALALAGFAVSLALVTKFLIPAILAGSPPLLVAVVGALAVMFVTVVLTYGLTPQSAAAALGIAASLLFAGVVGTIAVHTARLDGRGGELSSFLITSGGNLSLQGIVLAGLVIGALGVLADMGVTQASAVMALRRASPEMPPGQVFGEAFGVGRDHLIATTHTLVLAYVGATLPLLLVLQSSGVDFVDALNAQDVAEPIVATLVGAMALLVCVPITTALATALVARIPSEALPDGHAGHHHH
jgi:uncharacterized membrane protein